MPSRFFIILALTISLCSTVHANEGTSGTSAKAADTSSLQGESATSIRPIFSQLLTFSYPSGFKPVFENTRDGSYIHESVRVGESPEKWSEMITVTGAKGVTSNPDATPQKFAGAIAAGFKRACPETYSAAVLGSAQIDGHNAFAALVGCGIASTVGEGYSESAVVVVIEGDKDYYTIQWAERGGASKVPMKFDGVKWSERVKRLLPIKLSPAVPGGDSFPAL